MWTRFNDVDRMFHAMDQLQSRMNRIFNTNTGYRPIASWAAVDSGPRTNMHDAGDYLQLVMEVPGLAKEDLNVKLQGNYLEISGERKIKTPEGYSAHRVERGTTSFTRSFTLPMDVDSTKVEAALIDGILTLRMPKQEAAKPRQITIQ